MALASGIVISIAAFMNIAAAVFDFFRPRWLLDNFREAKLPLKWLPLLALAKAAGALGLLTWFVGFTPLAALAAVALVCFFVGAIVILLRAGAKRQLAFPSTYLAIAAASLALIIMSPSP